jgi:ATP-GRASP peptide maturase of grasp-with-spasm system
MILILSTPTDNDTNCVIDWLNYRKIPFFRLNDEELMQGIASFYFDINSVENSYIESYGKILFIKDIKVVWFRKFGFLNEYKIKVGRNNDLYDYINSEFKVIADLLMELLKEKKWLFDRKKMASKIEVLKAAMDSGLEIPQTLITTKKTDLDLFFKDNNRSIITKSIGEAKYVQYKAKAFMFHTHKIDCIEAFENNFSPSLFQEYIDKDVELRVFFINGKCYSMAIFSQNNPKTKIDYRNYDRKKPNRFVPYKLPGKIEMAIGKMMNELQLNTGSLDLIKSNKNGKYYFLEVNPAGQFGMVSFPCNYNLHKIVAEYLVELSNEL